MISSNTPTIGLVELPELGLFEPNGKNLLADRRGNALLSKQIVLSNLRSAGFDAQLINLKNGEYQKTFGKVIWNDTEITKVYIGKKIDDLEPSAYDVWGITNNFSQHRDIACMAIKHLASQGRPVVVGGSDAIAAPQVYLATGAAAVILDKSGAANAPIMDYVLGKKPREELSGVRLANSSQQPSPRAKQPLNPEQWALPELSVVQQCLGTTYKDLYLPKAGALIGSVFTDIGCDRKCDFCQTSSYRLGYRAMSPSKTLQWFKAQKDAGAWGVNNYSDQFMGRILKKGGREAILEIMKGIREMELAIFYPNGLELKKATLGRGINRQAGMDLTPDEELIEALWGWNGNSGCYLAYIPAERPIVGRQNYAKLLPWREHCEMMKAIVRAGIPYIIYGCIIGFPDDSHETLLRLEEAVVMLYETLLTINPSLQFQVLPVSIFPIPGTLQAEQIYQSELLRFDDPTLFGGVWTPAADTHYLSYKEIIKWQRHLMQIGNPYMQHQ